MSTARAHTTRPLSVAGPRHVAGGRTVAERAATRDAAWAVARLTARLVRRSVLATALAVGLYVAVEAASFLVGYPDEVSRAALDVWARDPSVRLISGPGTAVTTLGGFVLWDAGLFLHVIACAWALTATTRVLRGDEDAGRAELVLAAGVTPVRVLRAQLGVLLLGCLVVGAGAAGPLAVAGAPLWGSVLVGVAIAGFTGTAVCVAAVTTQLFETRGRSLGAAALVFAAALVLRVVANSGDPRAWMGWVTPFGWVDLLRAFDENRWPVLLIGLVAIVALAFSAVILRARREVGEELFVSHRDAPFRAVGLGSAVAFAWRTHRRVFQGWVAGLAVAAGVFGAMVRLVREGLANDPAFQQILSAVGMDVDDLTLGFAGFVATLLAVGVGLFAAFHVGATRTEESSGRAEQLLARPIRRFRWLGGHMAILAVSILALCVVAATAMWGGGKVAGEGLALPDVFAAVFNTLPAVAVFAGLDIMVFALWPRLTEPVGASAVVVAYVLDVVAPLLDLPTWVGSLSPFHHLQDVPVDPVGWPAAIVMAAIAVVLIAVGTAVFERRDLAGA